ADVRQVARKPEQLQLERESEGFQCRPPRRRARQLVEEVEEAGQGLERARVRLLLRKESQHRLAADEADPEPVRILSRVRMRLDQVDAGDRVQLAAPLVEEGLHVAQRLEPPPEARRRLADPLRDRAHTAALERVEVKDAVGLAEAER